MELYKVKSINLNTKNVTNFKKTLLINNSKVFRTFKPKL
jgi:hypothetical protein